MSICVITVTKPTVPPTVIVKTVAKAVITKPTRQVIVITKTC